MICVSLIKYDINKFQLFTYKAVNITVSQPVLSYGFFLDNNTLYDYLSLFSSYFKNFYMKKTSMQVFILYSFIYTNIHILDWAIIVRFSQKMMLSCLSVQSSVLLLAKYNHTLIVKWIMQRFIKWLNVIDKIDQYITRLNFFDLRKWLIFYAENIVI